MPALGIIAAAEEEKEKAEEGKDEKEEVNDEGEEGDIYDWKLSSFRLQNLASFGASRFPSTHSSTFKTPQYLQHIPAPSTHSSTFNTLQHLQHTPAPSTHSSTKNRNRIGRQFSFSFIIVYFSVLC